uniref:Cathepsin propeptide inhibitor domain-containing protein n=1 Tax=Leersia perrieri TaxID=77586 RepID=A0A0D9VUE6_9ORYZ
MPLAAIAGIILPVVVGTTRSTTPDDDLRLRTKYAGLDVPAKKQPPVERAKWKEWRRKHDVDYHGDVSKQSCASLTGWRRSEHGSDGPALGGGVNSQSNCPRVARHVL